MYDGINELTKADKLKLIRKVASEGVTHIHLLGGEPLVLPYIDEIIEECVKNGIYVSLNTNGHRLDYDISLCDLFAKNNVGVSFSVDGSNKKSHDTMRANGSFDIVMKAAENYGKSIQKYGLNTISAFYITLTPDNMNDDYSELFALADSYNVNNIILGVLIPKGAGEKNYDSSELTIDIIISQSKKFVQLGEQYKNIKVSFPFQTPLLIKYLNDELGTDLELCYTKCKSGVSEYQLQVDGALYPCVYVNDSFLTNVNKNDIRQENNLLEHGFDNILNNNFYKSFYGCMSDKKCIAHVTPCNKCPYYNSLDICRPCALQHGDKNCDVQDFHKSEICKEILKRNGDNFYF